MDGERKRYADDHWLRSQNAEEALRVYMDQQNKAYSRVKNAFIRELLGDLNGKAILDYGCGAGLFTVYAAQSGARKVVAVDAEESALSTARYFARKEGVEHRCTFISSETFPDVRKAGGFDVILMKDVIEHVPDDARLLSAAAEAVVPAGRLVVSTQNSLSLNYLIQGSYHRLWRGDKEWYGWDPTHVRFYTPMSLNRKLKDAGFKGVRWRAVYLIPYKLPAPRSSGKEFLRLDALSWIDTRLGKVFPYNRLGWNMIVRADASPLVSERVRITAPVPDELPVEPVLIARKSLRIKEQTFGLGSG